MIEAPLTELAAALGAKRISSVELTPLPGPDCRHQPQLNAFITVDPGKPRQGARRRRPDRARRARRSPESRSRTGHLLHARWLTTCASKTLSTSWRLTTRALSSSSAAPAL
jgi:hypothetical protein